MNQLYALVAFFALAWMAGASPIDGRDALGVGKYCEGYIVDPELMMIDRRRRYRD
jgi:hypothetical protein